MRSRISFVAASVLLAGFLASTASASNISARCGVGGSIGCTSGSCCSGLYCSAQSVCLTCRVGGAFCDDKNVPCCSTGGTNGGPLYCASTNICKGCLISGSFTDPLVPCCSGKSTSSGLCID